MFYLPKFLEIQRHWSWAQKVDFVSTLVDIGGFSATSVGDVYHQAPSIVGCEVGRWERRRVDAAQVEGRKVIGKW